MTYIGSLATTQYYEKAIREGRLRQAKAPSDKQGTVPLKEGELVRHFVHRHVLLWFRKQLYDPVARAVLLGLYLLCDHQLRYHLQ